MAQKPVPTPQVDDRSIVKISTDLIQVDVTVTDKNGKVVGGLSREDFEVFENGKKQTISNLSFISRTAGGATVNAGTARGPEAGPAAKEVLTRSAVRRTIAIVLDDLNLSFLSVNHARKALRRFVDEQMEPGDLVAIIRTGGAVGALQQFTSDKKLLHAAIDRIRWNPLAGSVEALTPIAQNDTDITDRFNR